MSIIDELRRKGDLSQAYDIAKERLRIKSNKDLIKRDLARVLTDLLQKNCFAFQADHFFDYLNEFYSLEISRTDSVIHENIMWQVGKFIKELTRAEAHSQIFDRLYGIISDIELPRSSSLFTFITSSVLESKDLNDSYINVLLKCRVRHLSANHFEAINEDGEKKPSLGELLLLTIAKNVTHRDNLIKSDVLILLEELEYVEENYSNIPYVNYYKAKAYNCLGNKLKAEEEILIYLKKRSKEYLAWELLSDISDDKERKVQALSKSVICHTRPGQLLRSKTKLFYLLVKEKKFDVAKSLYKNITKTKQELGKNVSDDWLSLSNDKWFKSVKKEVDYLNYCYNRSNDIVAYVFKDWKTHHGIIYGLNLVKDLAEFVVTDDMHGAFKYFGDKRFRVGDFVSLKLQRVANHEGVKYKALYVKKSEKRPKRNIYKVLEDEISKNNERYFVGTVPINFSFLKSKGYKLGDIVRVKAVKLPSSRVKEENKWKVLSLYNIG